MKLESFLAQTDADDVFAVTKVCDRRGQREAVKDTVVTYPLEDLVVGAHGGVDISVLLLALGLSGSELVELLKNISLVAFEIAAKIKTNKVRLGRLNVK